MNNELRRVDEYKVWALYVENDDEGTYAPLCQNCQHWTRPEQMTGHTMVDERISSVPDYGACERTRIDVTILSEENPLAFAIDEAFWKAVLRTAPTFGCVQFAPLEPQELRQSAIVRAADDVIARPAR